MEEIVINLVQSNPTLSMIFLVIGVLRAINKPLFSVIKTVVDATPSQNDNVIYNKIINSKAYEVLSYSLDWVASVKAPKAKK